jgi:hypothetical protein
VVVTTAPEALMLIVPLSAVRVSFAPATTVAFAPVTFAELLVPVTVTVSLVPVTNTVLLAPITALAAELADSVTAVLVT